MLHKHHIIPRHMGGTDDPENLIELTVEEHAEAHKKLYEEYGRWQDYLAWQGLSGRIDKEDIIRLKISLANRGKPSWNKGMKLENTENHKKSAKKRANTEMGLKHLRDISVLGPKAREYSNLSENQKTRQSKKQKENWNNGVYGEDRNNKISKAHMGKKWYNNGTIEYRYYPGSEPHDYVLGRKKRNAKQ